MSLLRDFLNALRRRLLGGQPVVRIRPLLPAARYGTVEVREPAPDDWHYAKPPRETPWIHGGRRPF